MSDINYGPAPVIALPCPFCGSGRLGFHADGGDPTPGMVECLHCESMGPWVEGEDSYLRAHQAWNIRGRRIQNLSWKERGLLEANPSHARAPGAMPCPFCGSEEIYKGDPDDWDSYFFACSNCDACGPWCETENMALKGWNRRFVGKKT